ncbi:YgaP family membrane protein, partial [Thiothrix litoralis]
MEKNVGSMDRNIRFGAGAVLLIWGLVFKGGILLTLIGIV